MKFENLVYKMIGISEAEIGSETAMEHRKKLFEKAKKSIRIVHSNVPDETDLDSAIKRNVSIELIIGPGKNLHTLMSLTSKGIAVYELEESPVEQFDIVDGKHVRFEASIPEVQNTQYIFHNSIDSSKYLRKFSNLKEEAKKR